MGGMSPAATRKPWIICASDAALNRSAALTPSLGSGFGACVITPAFRRPPASRAFPAVFKFIVG